MSHSSVEPELSASPEPAPSKTPKPFKREKNTKQKTTAKKEGHGMKSKKKANGRSKKKLPTIVLYQFMRNGKGIGMRLETLKRDVRKKERRIAEDLDCEGITNFQGGCFKLIQSYSERILMQRFRIANKIVQAHKRKMVTAIDWDIAGELIEELSK